MLIGPHRIRVRVPRNESLVDLRFCAEDRARDRLIEIVAGLFILCHFCICRLYEES